MPRRHNRELIPMLREACLRAGIELSDLQLIGYVCGPGSFTGLRISVGLIQGLAFGLKIPTVPVSALAALAAQCSNTDCSLLVAAQHARADELFCGFYQPAESEPGGVRLLGKERLVSVRDLKLPDGIRSYLGIGSAWQQMQLRSAMTDHLGKPCAVIPQADPDIAWVQKLALGLAAGGAAQPAFSAVPSYLREQVAQPS